MRSLENDLAQPVSMGVSQWNLCSAMIQIPCHDPAAGHQAAASKHTVTPHTPACLLLPARADDNHGGQL